MDSRWSALVSGVLVALLAAGTLGAAPASAATAVAIAVFGQANFTSANSGITAGNLNTPTGSAHDPVHHRLFITDGSAHRVLVYNLNTNNSTPDTTADFVLGQANFTSNSSALTATGMNTPETLVYDSANDRLYVADDGNRRVLVFDTASITNGESAAYVLGQPDFTTAGAVTTQSSLTRSRGVALGSDNRYLFASDHDNRRVMVWDTTALSNGMNATYVLGQANFTSSTPAVSQTSTFFPWGVAVDSVLNRLYVANASANRVTVYDLGSLATNMNALYVIGQTNFTNNSSGLTQSTMSGPRGIAAGSGKLVVVDRGNQRALVYDTADTSNGQNATGLYGQPDYTTTGVNTGGRSESSLAFPSGASYDPGTTRFYVADSLNNRVLGYSSGSNGSTVASIVDPSFTFSVAGTGGATCNYISLNAPTQSATAIGFGHVSTSTLAFGRQTLAVSTNGNGFTVYMRATGAMSSGSHSIVDWTGSNATPTATWAAGSEYFGYTTNDRSLGTGTAARFNPTNDLAGARFAALTTSNAEVMYDATGPVSAATSCVGYQLGIGVTTPAGSYGTTVLYTAVPLF